MLIVVRASRFGYTAEHPAWQIPGGENFYPDKRDFHLRYYKQLGCLYESLFQPKNIIATDAKRPKYQNALLIVYFFPFQL